jgi:hypothetical protein
MTDISEIGLQALIMEESGLFIFRRKTTSADRKALGKYPLWRQLV